MKIKEIKDEKGGKYFPKCIFVNAILMENGEIICQGKTINKKFIFEAQI